MRLYGEDISGGSKDRITPEAEWMAKQSFKWTDSEEDNKETVPNVESDKERASDHSA